MGNAIDLSDFGLEIMNILETELEEIQSSVNNRAIVLAKELAQDIKEDSPKDKGTYSKGWSARKTKTGAIVHNTKKPYLTWILEYGHNASNGKRIAGKPHIYKNAKRITERFEEDCIKIVSEGVRY